MKLPLWSIVPFVLVVLSVALLPGLTPRFWKKYNWLLLATYALPILSLSAAININWVIGAFVDYVSFICLLGALFVIGGGLHVNGSPKANPVTNLSYMALGCVLANIIGTLGASMLLIRPLLRSNRGRKHQAHVVIFFIFIVSNAAGLLTPLGDPPLFLGFLMGVPFSWTLKLFPIWFFVLTSLLGLFVALDASFYVNDPDFRGPLNAETKESFRITGRWNFALIPLVIAGLILPVSIPADLALWRVALRVFILLTAIYLSLRITPKVVHTANNFSWDPFRDVAVIFAAIFITMAPAIYYLEVNAPNVGIDSAWAFFWYPGMLSGIFNNAPVYASFFAMAQGLGKDFIMLNLDGGKQISEPLLMALSCGCVFFGALTYLGNGPNYLVKAVAEEEAVKMPSFFGFLLWSLVFLVPVLFITATVFFR
jgi:Na+/H+ antiporter NhaD/arsenite permease-like protein